MARDLAAATTLSQAPHPLGSAWDGTRDAAAPCSARAFTPCPKLSQVNNKENETGQRGGRRVRSKMCASPIMSRHLGPLGTGEKTTTFSHPRGVFPCPDPHSATRVEVGTDGDSGGLRMAPAQTSAQSPASMFKRCGTCKQTRSPLEFPRHNGAKDGRRNSCRACLLSGRYQPYIEPPSVRALRKARESKPKWQRSHRKALQRHAERNPVQAAAQRALKAAVRAGRIDRAETCQVAGCSSRLHIEAHHHDYARPLEVLWCCAAHHRQGHAQGFITPADGIPSHYGAIPEMAAEPAEAA